MKGKGYPNYCYRLRPMNDLTIEELNNHYLWFSKRSGFNDECDANIGAFIEDTPQIKSGLQLRYSREEIDEIIRRMDNIGICCFTKKLPSKKNLVLFPNGKKSICVEYNKKIIEDYFLNKYALAHPFKNVIYDAQPTKIESDGNYHILTKKYKDGCLYQSIYDIFSDIRKVDDFFELLLTRINARYSIQKEMRIILGGRILENLDTSLAGYKIEIPKDAISKIYLLNTPSLSYCQELEKISSIKWKLEFINDN